MAWESRADEVMPIVGNHMAVMDDENRIRMCEIFAEIFFPNRHESWGHAIWVTHWGVTFVTMWNEEHSMRNISYANEGSSRCWTPSLLHLVQYDATF